MNIAIFFLLISFRSQITDWTDFERYKEFEDAAEKIVHMSKTAGKNHPREMPQASCAQYNFFIRYYLDKVLDEFKNSQKNKDTIWRSSTFDSRHPNDEMIHLARKLSLLKIQIYKYFELLTFNNPAIIKSNLSFKEIDAFQSLENYENVGETCKSEWIYTNKEYFKNSLVREINSLYEWDSFNSVQKTIHEDFRTICYYKVGALLVRSVLNDNFVCHENIDLSLFIFELFYFGMIPMESADDFFKGFFYQLKKMSDSKVTGDEFLSCIYQDFMYKFFGYNLLVFLGVDNEYVEDLIDQFLEENEFDVLIDNFVDFYKLILQIISIKEGREESKKKLFKDKLASFNGEAWKTAFKKIGIFTLKLIIKEAVNIGCSFIPGLGIPVSIMANIILEKPKEYLLKKVKTMGDKWTKEQETHEDLLNFESLLSDEYRKNSEKEKTGILYQGIDHFKNRYLINKGAETYQIEKKVCRKRRKEYIPGKSELSDRKLVEVKIQELELRCDVTHHGCPAHFLLHTNVVTLNLLDQSNIRPEYFWFCLLYL